MRRLASVLAVVAAAALAAPCTIFVVARNGQVFAGANEDYMLGDRHAKHWIRFVPATRADRLGYVGFGYEFSPVLEQAAMNEAGLFYDYNALPLLEKPNPGAPEGSVLNLWDMISSCRTVDEAVAFLRRFDLSLLSKGQMVIGDATGASAILERHTVTRRPAGLDYQIGTNFRTSTTPKSQITCWRYKRCDATLSRGQAVSAESVRSLLEATMPPAGSGSVSWYSTVCDLRAATVVLFRKGEFSKAATLDLKKELAHGARTVDMDTWMKPRLRPWPTVEAFESGDLTPSTFTGFVRRLMALQKR